MSILDDGVFSSTSYNGYGLFKFNFISNEQKNLLKSITKRARNKFKNNGLVPWQLLWILWDLGFLPGEERPEKEGMRIPVLLKFLRDGQYINEEHRERGEWFYEKINPDRLLPDKVGNESFVKFGDRKWISVSQIRDMPGTIVR